METATAEATADMGEATSEDYSMGEEAAAEIATEAGGDDDGAEGEPKESFTEWKERNGLGEKKAEKETKEQKTKDEPAKAESSETQGSQKEDDAGKVDQDDGNTGEGNRETSNEPRTYTYKVDGEEKTAQVSEKDIPQMLSKVAGADARMREAADIKKQAGELVNWIKDNPIEALAKVGVDFAKIAEDHVYEKIQYENMTPEQQQTHDRLKKAEADERELKRYREHEEAQRKQEQEQIAEQKRQQQIAHERQLLEAQITQAIQATGLPANKFTVTRMAAYLKQGMANGMTAMDAAPMVKRDYDEAMEQARQQRLAENREKKAAKQAAKEAEQPRTTQHRPKTGRRKQVSSIYDLLE